MKDCLKVLLSLFAFVLIVTGCKKDKVDPEPEPPKMMGKLITCTNISKSKFDRIDITIDGKVVGTLTQPYVVKPKCGTENSASSNTVSLEIGVHKVGAIQYKDDKVVGKWPEEEETIFEGKCTPISWVD